MARGYADRFAFRSESERTEAVRTIGILKVLAEGNPCHPSCLTVGEIARLSEMYDVHELVILELWAELPSQTFYLQDN
jgi:hypothetical protein